MSVTAIIVNFHTASLIPPLIQDLEDDANVTQIIVVDNSNDFPDHLMDPSVKGGMILHNAVNRGFGAAVNQGIGCSAGEWILVANPDIRIEKNCIRRMMDAATQYGTSLAGPRFYLDDDHVFRIPPASGACFWQDTAMMTSLRYRLDADLFSFYWILRHERFWEASEPFVEPFLSGACLLAEKKWIDAHDGKLFDERFFLYYEDTDLCIRALRDGVRPLCVPGADVVHYYDQSPSPDRSKLSFMEASHRLFREAYYPSGGYPENETMNGVPECIIPGMEDRGEITLPPKFHWHQPQYNEKQYVEIGVNPYFVPLAQAEVEAPVFEFPQQVWNHLAPGQYYARVRGKISGIQKVVKWKKLQ